MKNYSICPCRNDNNTYSIAIMAVIVLPSWHTENIPNSPSGEIWNKISALGASKIIVRSSEPARKQYSASYSREFSTSFTCEYPNSKMEGYKEINNTIF